MSRKLIMNAKIYTVDPSNPWCECVVLEGERILAAGNRKEVAPFITDHDDVEVIDAEGRLVLPGFIDAHCHPTVAAYRTNNLDVFKCTAKEEYQSVIKAYAEANQDLDVIKGSGWHYADFGGKSPHKSVIDEVVRDRPVMIYSGDFHSLWVNSCALEKAGITDDVESPYGGSIEKDSEGRLTGYFNETPAVRYIEARLSSFGPEDYKAGALQFFKEANSVGITAVHDAGVLDDAGWDGYKLISEEELTLNVFLTHLVMPDEKDSLEEAVKNAHKRKGEMENSHIRLNTIKALLDGVPEANTAMLEEPYINEPDNRGEPQWNLNSFEELCVLAGRDGFQLHVHTIGDRAVREALNALEKSEKVNGKQDLRHMLAHLQLVNQEDIPRMEKIGAVAVPTALWFEKAEMYYEVELHNLGKERADREYPMRSFIDEGVLTACGSDAPVGIVSPVLEISFSPLQAIQQGLLRCSPLKDAGKPDNVLNPRERSTLEQMIETYTINGAKANFAEGEMGSIAPGKLANLIVLENNIFEIPPEEIYKTKVLKTFFKGKVVWEA